MILSHFTYFLCTCPFTFIDEETCGKAPCAANLLLPGASGASVGNQSLPEPSVLETDKSNLIQLMDIFPEKGRDELVHALRIYGTISRTALSLSSSTVHNIDDSHNDDLAQPTFAPTLMSLLKELEKGLNQEKEKLKVDEDDILQAARF